MLGRNSSSEEDEDDDYFTTPLVSNTDHCRCTFGLALDGVVMSMCWFNFNIETSRAFEFLKYL